MFDIGWMELMLVGVVALLVVGPKELPGLLRTLGKYAGMLKKQASEFRAQFDEAIQDSEFQDLKKDVEGIGEDAEASMRDAQSALQDDIGEFDEFDKDVNLDDEAFEDDNNDPDGDDPGQVTPQEDNVQTAGETVAQEEATEAAVGVDVDSDAGTKDAATNDGGSHGQQAMNGSHAASPPDADAGDAPAKANGDNAAASAEGKG